MTHHPARLFILALLLSIPLFGEVDTLTLMLTHPKSVSARWSGGSIVSSGSDGTLTLASTGTVFGILNVLCNARTGYNVTFSAANATSTTASVLKKVGAGTTTDTQMPYTVAMDLSQFSASSTMVASTLKLNGSGASVSATFSASGKILPIDNATANQIKLTFTLTAFNPEDKYEGVYQDVITATVVTR